MYSILKPCTFCISCPSSITRTRSPSASTVILLICISSPSARSPAAVFCSRFLYLYRTSIFLQMSILQIANRYPDFEIP
nr:MAG TPA: restriction alleviation protein [Caudoviricetes sp.]